MLCWLAGSDLPNALDLLFTYPFPNTAVNSMCFPAASDGRVRCGDYTNMVATLNLDLATLLENLTGPSGSPSLPPAPDLFGTTPPATPVPSSGPAPTVPTAPTVPAPPLLPGLPSLPGLGGGGGP